MPTSHHLCQLKATMNCRRYIACTRLRMLLCDMPARSVVLFVFVCYCAMPVFIPALCPNVIRAELL